MSPIVPLILIPLVGAAMSLLPWALWRRCVFFVSVFANAAAASVLWGHVSDSGYVVVQAGGWAAPYGITLLADKLSAIMLALNATLAIAAAIAVAFPQSRDADLHRHAGLLPAFLFLLLGINGFFLSGDLFNMYVWFELTLIASFALLTIGNDRRRLTGAVKYLTLGLISSSFLLIGTAAIYAATGTLNLAALLHEFPKLPAQTQAVLWAFFITAFGSKAAIFPLFFWLPATYPHLTYPVAGFSAGILTKTGVYALVRLVSVLGLGEADAYRQWLLIIAAFTMLVGVLGAVAQKEIRRLLSFHIISQVGYLVLALALHTAIATAALVFFLIHITITKAALFYLADPISEMAGGKNLSDMRGLYRKHPYTSMVFLIGALSLAGLPPFSGFWAKLFVVHASFDAQAYFLGAIGLVVSFLTLYSMVKIWLAAFWQGDHPPAQEIKGWPAWRPLLPALFLTVCVLTITLFTANYWGAAMTAADQLMSPTYAEVVLEKGA